MINDILKKVVSVSLFKKHWNSLLKNLFIFDCFKIL